MLGTAESDYGDLLYRITDTTGVQWDEERGRQAVPGAGGSDGEECAWLSDITYPCDKAKYLA